MIACARTIDVQLEFLTGWTCLVDTHMDGDPKEKGRYEKNTAKLPCFYKKRADDLF